MAIHAALEARTEGEVHAEIEHLRQDLLNILLITLPLLLWAWLYYAVSKGYSPGANALPVALITGAALGAWRLGERRPAAARALLVLGTVLALGALMVSYPASLAIVFGVLAIILANALLGGGGAGLTTLAVSGFALWAGARAGGGGPWSARTAEALALYALTLGACWVAARPLRDSTELALAGWSQVRDALIEVRARRAELFRTVRALEEASYRIERMNHELLVAQREAEEARETKGRFVATVSHELRGPLNLILGFTRLMALSPKSYPEPLPGCYRADIYTVYRSCQHLLALVDDILDLSQIEAQRLPLVRDRIELNEDVVRRAVHMIEPLAERKGLSVHLELAEDLPWILADPVRLRQAILNLLTNAVRFTERGGITVKTLAREDAVLVTVQDTGPGIAEADIPKLFREFTQVHPKAVADEGSGLGLAISKQLIELHGGEIWVESQPGRGTAFWFALPLPSGASRPAAVMSTGRVAHHVGLPSCVIVHDDESIIRVLARHITGYRVVGLAQPESLPALITDLHPRAVLTTPALADQVEAQIGRSRFDVPLITCAIPRTPEHSRFASVLGYLIKPVDVDMLMTMVKRVEQNGQTEVLLVDDDPEAVRLLERMLMALPHPYQVHKAYDGDQALRLMRDTAMDLVFLDLVMPGVDGKQVLYAMQANDRLSTTPVVIISGQDVIDSSLELGPDLALQARSPLPLAQGLTCLQALLEAVSPDYLSEATAPRAPATDQPEAPAFAARPEPPGPTPGAAR